MEASISSLDRSSTTISDLYKGLNVITQLLKYISNSVKDNPATNQKLNEATKTFIRNSSNLTKIMLLTFQGQPSLAPSGSVTPTLALTNIQANVEGENVNTTSIEEPPSHTEGETEEPRLEIPISSIPSIVILPNQAQPITSIILHLESSQATPKIDKGKGIATESDDDPSKKLDKEEQIKKAKEEARLNAISKPEVIKVVHEEANKLGIHPKEAITTKAGELFKKDQDAKHKTVSSKLKPEPITNIKIHPKTKLVVITVYRGTDGRNFDVHKPFLFGAFGISELDELREIISKKKNTVVKDLMNSLSRRKLIVEHPDKEKLKSKKVKLKALRYKMDWVLM
ncbi:hypothetical protein Tco_0612525 [Tanacetum coccineum]